VGLQKEDAVRAVRLGEKHHIPVANFVFETPTWIERTWRSFAGNRRFEETWEEFRRSLLASDRIIANSELTRTETEKWLGRKVDGVAHPGIDKTLADSVPEQKRRYQAIYLGAVEKRIITGIMSLFAASTTWNLQCSRRREKTHNPRYNDINICCKSR